MFAALQSSRTCKTVPSRTSHTTFSAAQALSPCEAPRSRSLQASQSVLTARRVVCSFYAAAARSRTAMIACGSCLITSSSVRAARSSRRRCRGYGQKSSAQRHRAEPRAAEQSGIAIHAADATGSASAERRAVSLHIRWGRPDNCDATRKVVEANVSGRAMPYGPALAGRARHVPNRPLSRPTGIVFALSDALPYNL